MSIVEDQLKAIAREVGFDVARIARADAAWEAGSHLTEFVAAGRHGDMGWIEETLARRSHPTAMWPAAKSALVVGLNYGPAHDPLEPLARPEHATISVYAQNVDYHDLMKRRLKQLASAFATKTGHDVKVFVDTAPLMEKPLAHRSGIGWQGKHTNLVSRDHGSWLFLGVMLTDADLQPDDPGDDTCGSCSACVDICPTQAFPAPYQLDARRCISYLTIETKTPIPREFRKAIGNRIYGCDDCLAICPWNKFASTARDAAFHPRAELTAPLLSDLAELDDMAFREVFAGSPIKRIGRDRFIRNVMISIGNAVQKTDKTRLVELCIQKLDDASPLVRGASVWALGSLSPTAFEAERLSRRDVESDPGVCEEWDAGPA
ncbi:MAG TPA: tRNA epoxyqueuosine(34) reductase QueG [Hyphomonadaceae bacterium]|nr:tRNA epoxyqueuosine(34) reductase QueG [Hyphomonadaceae bacterium]HPN05786.1 tRNA epoxyqueuosine(34) reductase QueG [Hyphomonadaceae bacterium]